VLAYRVLGAKCDGRGGGELRSPSVNCRQARSAILRYVRGSASRRHRPSVDPRRQTFNTGARVIELPFGDNLARRRYEG